MAVLSAPSGFLLTSDRTFHQGKCLAPD